MDESSGSSSGAGAALVSIQPHDKLVFSLKQAQENRVKLFVRNTSKEHVVFKVKTTMPTCYFVKPNQDVLGIDGKVGVDIALTKEESSRLLGLAAPEKALKHRFMVQNKAISAAEYEQISQLPPSQKAEKLAQIWAAPETKAQEKAKFMLSVEFVYPAKSLTSSLLQGGSAPEVSVSENVDILRNRLANESVLLSDVSVGSGGMMTKEMILQDLDTLKQKLDAMINYTVKLTAERDSLVLTLEAAQKERGRDRRARRAREGGDAANGGLGKKSSLLGGSIGSFPILLAVMFISFIVGRYYL